MYRVCYLSALKTTRTSGEKPSKLKPCKVILKPWKVIVGGWTNPSEKKQKNTNWIISPKNRGEHLKCENSPPIVMYRFHFLGEHWSIGTSPPATNTCSTHLELRCNFPELEKYRQNRWVDCFFFQVQQKGDTFFINVGFPFELLRIISMYWYNISTVYTSGRLEILAKFIDAMQEGTSDLRQKPLCQPWNTLKRLLQDLVIRWLICPWWSFFVTCSWACGTPSSDSIHGLFFWAKKWWQPLRDNQIILQIYFCMFTGWLYS